MRNTPLILGALTTLVLTAIISIAIISGTNAAGANADKFSVDMDPATAPANTSTSLGSRQNCARINENDTLDADEDTTADRVDLDVTATNIPNVADQPSGTTAMVGFSFKLGYSAANTKIVAKNNAGLLSTADPYIPLDLSDSVPDTDGIYAVDVADLGASGVSGSGFLMRLTIETNASATTGQYNLTLTDANHIGTSNTAHTPDAIENGAIAINQACGGGPTTAPPTSPPPTTPPGTITNTPTPTPTPTESPTDTPTPSPTECPSCTPTPTPTPSQTPSPTPTPCDTNCPTDTPTPTPTPTATPTPFVRGDVDCSDGSSPVGSVDALKLLRYVAQLSVSQNEPCTDIGQDLGVALNTGNIQGDINCDDNITAVDALFILRHVAQLNVNLPGGCPPIGQ